MPLFFRSVVLFLAVSASALAAFLNNYSDWQRMDSLSQLRYVQGLADNESTNVWVGELDWQAASREGTDACLSELKITADMLADAITDHYKSNIDDWSLPPGVIYSQVTQRICLNYINAERQERGLAPWEKSNGSISAGFN